MTGLIPYATYPERGPILLAIASDKPPADLANLSVPHFVTAVLERCWRKLADSRPTVAWCSKVLSLRSTALFKPLCLESFDAAPSEFKAMGDGWHALFNPETETTFNLQMSTTFDNVHVSS